MYPDWTAPFFTALRQPPKEVALNRWAICCPAHDDRRASASAMYNPESGCLVVRCHSLDPCSFFDIAAACGLKPIDFLDPAKRVGKAGKKLHFIEAYNYRDEKEILLYQSVRWIDPETQKKTFTYRRPNPGFNKSEPASDSNPKWLNGIGNTRRILYRLPELLEAVAEIPGRYVFVLEGEKAVDNVRAGGLVATCNPFGAGKWLPEFCETLRGMNVVVVPDQDDPDPKTGLNPGLDHAADVALSLYGVAGTVRVLHLEREKPGDGLDDWLQRGHGADALRELVLGCDRYTPPPEAVGEDLLLLAAELHREQRRGRVNTALAWHGSATAACDRLRTAASIALGDHDISDDYMHELRAAALRAAAAIVSGIRFLRR